MKEHDTVIVTSGFSLRPLLLVICANPVKASLFSWPLSRTLKISLWIAEGLALELEVIVEGQKINTRPKFLL